LLQWEALQQQITQIFCVGQIWLAKTKFHND